MIFERLPSCDRYEDIRTEGTLAECRKDAADTLRGLRRKGFAVYTSVTGSLWKVYPPHNCTDREYLRLISEHGGRYQIRETTDADVDTTEEE